MKKSYLMIATAATLLTACADNDNFKEINNEGSKIGFSTYSQKATRATENSSASYGDALKDHHGTFQVWGFKNTSADAVFFNETVTFDDKNDADPSNDVWTYDNSRYWDKVANDYYFYAFAPADANTPFTLNGYVPLTANPSAADIAATKASQDDGYFTIANSYNKAGENVSAFAKSTANPKVASATATTSWTAAGAGTDVDLMIAAVKHLSKDDHSLDYSTVQLNFIHILSRLNITVKTVQGFNPTVADNDIVVVNNITIGNMKKSGTFSENTAITGTLAAGTYERWTTTTVANDTEYSYDLGYDADLTAKYVIEALMLPQVLETEEIAADGSDTETKPYLYINYSIFNHAKDAASEQIYEAYYNLATILTANASNNNTASNTAFNEGWQNNINISIEPGKINFDANVAQWAVTNENTLTIQ